MTFFIKRLTIFYQNLDYLFRNNLYLRNFNYKLFSSIIMPPKRSNASTKRPKVFKTTNKSKSDIKPLHSESESGSDDAADVLSKRSKIESVEEINSNKPEKWTVKFSSWNVNGIRAWATKKSYMYITKNNPDVFAVQETKCEKDKIPDVVKIDGYHTYWLSGDKDGYSGIGLYTKIKPLNVLYGIECDEHDKEGRVITAEYDEYYFVAAYIPNSGRGLKRLDYRTKEWDPSFRDYLIKLDKKKPIIFCGDLNVAHLEIDLKNPKSNRNKTPGFTDAERKEFSNLLDSGFVDTYRHLYPKKEDVFSFWTYMNNARMKNIGWRLDYFVISKRLEDKLYDSIIQNEILGSDHCPIELLMNF